MGKPSSAAARPTVSKYSLTTSTQESWGFLHPECHGQNALLFFSWDLAKTIEQQFQLHAGSPLSVQLQEAQKAVDRLLKQYVQIQANPTAFEGQSITLHLEESEEAPGEAVLALETSPHLESLILQVQADERARSTLN